MLAKMILVASVLTTSTAFAQLTFLIPPQYACKATDSSGQVFVGTSSDQEEAEVKTFANTANESMIVTAVESAMKKCVSQSSAPASCDLLACKENPQ